MKSNQELVSLRLDPVEYDPGDAVGSPVETTLEEALSYWKHDTAYLQTLLDCTVVSRVHRWPTIRCAGREVPKWRICRMAESGP